MKPLAIIAFFDGRPGHEKQTRGVLAALARLTSLTVAERRVDRPGAVTTAGRWLGYLAGTVVGRRPEQAPAADLIIGTGTSTHIPMLLAKKRWGGRAVTCMTPNRPLARAFDLCFVPRHDRTRPAANIVFTTGPPNPLVYGTGHDPNQGLVLVGGVDPKSHVWHTDDVVDRIACMIEKEPDRHWTLASSPRTPEETEARLDRLARDRPTVSFFRAADTLPGWIEKAYGQSAVVWVTADSISMVYEALSAGCRVGILPVAWKRRRGKFQRSENYLLENRLVTSYETWLENGRMADRPPRLDEAGRCAEEILRRWWPDRLP
ncbi:MAG: mitochondrial fission ELM1 family protein [Desulfobacterales bacterium]|nr:mitochondrial fission ELM1 family protein [Desulfobacterales bacterium]